MDNVRILRYDWYTGMPGYGSVGEYLARQYDHLSDMVVLSHAPKLNNYYLIVTMKESEGGEVRTLEPIQLSGSFWLIPNIYTQLAQDISFQLCCKTESGDFESHSAEIHGRILPSKDHNGVAIDVDPSVMFDPYKQWVSEIAMAAGAIVIDSELSGTSTNPVQNNVIKAAIDGLDGRLDVQQSAIGDLSQLQTENKTDLVSAINEAAQSGGAAIDIDTSLEKNGWAADAAEVGVKIAAVNFDLVVDALGNATITRNDYIDTRKVKY